MPGTRLSGRRRMPTAELAKYNPSRAKKRKNEPNPLDTKLMIMPADYNESEKQIWEFHFAICNNLRTLSASDFAMLDQFTRCYAEFIYLEKFIKEHGRTYTEENGNQAIRAEVRLRNDTRKELRSLCVQFGFSPSSRTSVEKVPELGKFKSYGLEDWV